jgi:transketolase C-terminal domain/subunit
LAGYRVPDSSQIRPFDREILETARNRVGDIAVVDEHAVAIVIIERVALADVIGENGVLEGDVLCIDRVEVGAVESI